MTHLELRDRIDRHHPTWVAIEEYLTQNIKKLQEALELPRKKGLERIDQGKIRMCRDLLDAARPLRPEGEKGPESGVNYGFQDLSTGPRF